MYLVTGLIELHRFKILANLSIRREKNGEKTGNKLNNTSACYDTTEATVPKLWQTFCLFLSIP